MKMIIEFDMDNAAFENKGIEVARILQKLTSKIENGIEADFESIIKDYNGNTVGTARVELTASEYQDSLS